MGRHVLPLNFSPDFLRGRGAAKGETLPYPARFVCCKTAFLFSSWASPFHFGGFVPLGKEDGGSQPATVTRREEVRRRVRRGLMEVRGPPPSPDAHPLTHPSLAIRARSQWSTRPTFSLPHLPTPFKKRTWFLETEPVNQTEMGKGESQRKVDEDELGIE